MKRQMIYNVSTLYMHVPFSRQVCADMNKENAKLIALYCLIYNVSVCMSCKFMQF